MAEVFVATSRGDGGFEKTVAVKRILPHLCEEAETVAMFRDEAHLASRLNHPNIAQVFDLVEDDQTLLIAMEWIAGKDLRRILQRARKNGPRLTPMRAVAIARTVAEALAHAHAAKDGDGEPLLIVHRDVTPHNVMVTFEGVVKLTDFGIARATQRSVNTATGMIKGKVAYMSPEQARGEPVDARTDVFALGVILWEMLCDRRLFTGESDLAILRAVQEQPAPPPGSIVEGLPGRLDDLVLAALRRDRDDRLPDAESFARAAGEILMTEAGHPDDLALGPWMKALYPAESQGVRAGTARRPADLPGPAPIAPPPPPPATGGAHTRPDLPGALGPEEGAGAVAVTSAIGPGQAPGPSSRRRRWLLFGVALLWVVALGGLGLDAFDLGPFAPRGARPTPPPLAPPENAATLPETAADPEASADPEPAGTSAGTPVETEPAATAAPPPDAATPAIARKPTKGKQRRRPGPRPASRTGPRAPAPGTPDATPETSARQPDPPPREEPASPPAEDPDPAPTPAPTEVADDDAAAAEGLASPGPGARGGTRVLSRRASKDPDPIVLGAGTILEARLLDPARAGRETRLTLDRSVVRAGAIALPRGTRLTAMARAADRRLLLEVRGGFTPGGRSLDLRARLVDAGGRAGLPAFDPSAPAAPLLLAPGTRLRLELIEPLSLGP